MANQSNYYRLGRALFGVYNVHSGGLAHDGRPVPSWSAIMAREHDKAGTPANERIGPLDDGVLAHWRHVATEVATSPKHADVMARAIEDRHAGNAIFLRLIS